MPRFFAALLALTSLSQPVDNFRLARIAVVARNGRDIRVRLRVAATVEADSAPASPT